MRMLIFFDLPTIRVEDRKDYIRFRRFLIKSGFIMLQESVYTKLILNASVAEGIKTKLEKEKPNRGLVQFLIITEKQYAGMQNLVGNSHSNINETTERLIIL